METKKTITADLERQKGLFLLMGFVLVLGLIFIAFEWTEQEIKVYEQTGMAGGPLDEDTVIVTQRLETPPPPAPEPPVVTPEIKIVENNVATESTDAFDSETTEEDVIIAKPIETKIEEEDDQVIFVAVEKNPEFPGGMEALYKYLGSEVSYPAAQKEMGIQGRVICQFVVNTDGSIVDVVVVKGVDPELDKEAIRVIKKMPKWVPGEQSKKKVRVKYTLPIVFKIQD
ncbi:MAG: energy transducer TonB [Paludibacteraceae bacterium]|nr:energy transducer TonB [Paludibacteraceae bacterium]